VLLVSSSGGVLLDLMGLRPWWSRHESQWVAVPAVDTKAALAGCTVDWVPERVAGRPLGAVAGVWQAWRLLGRAQPDVVVSAGTGVAIGFFVAARVRRIPSLWLETLNLVGDPGLASRVCSRLASRVLVQRSEQCRLATRTVVVGELY
jgi:hypothetical protein